jgi:hypothetical protein
MVTTLTRMIPDLDKSLDIVSRELVGSCRLSPSTHAPPALAAGQAVVVPITPASTVSDITPGVSGHWPGRRELHGPVGRRRDRAALGRRGRYARIMALPKPPDDEIAELKQRIAALEASKPPNPKGAGRAEAKALAAAAMDECSRCSYRGPGRSRGGAAWPIFTPAGGSESHLERALVRPRQRRERVTMRA